MTQAELRADIVIRACERYLDKRNRRIEAKREKMIEDCMRFPRIWRRIFGKPIYLTREEAIKHLESGSELSNYNMLAMKGGYWASKVEMLKDLAEATIMVGRSNFVKVDSELAALLKQHIKAAIQESEEVVA